MVRFWKVLEMSSYAVGAIAFIIMVGLQQQWFWTAPLVPVPEQGRVHSFSVHGKTVYITRREQNEFNASMIITFMGFGLSLWIEGYKRPFSKRPFDDDTLP
jgi:hypothetical protein